MATISSTGIGSNLDVNSIVTQLVALEKQPLKLMAIKATNVKAQISAFGEIQSQFAALTDVATRISVPSTWGARNASSSNTSAATMTAAPTANATSFSLDVVSLAQPQSISSAALLTDTKPGAGTLTFELGTWSTGPTSFTNPTAATVNVTVLATDKISDIAAKINAASTGVVATAFNDGAKVRLMLRAKDTGVAAGFRVQSGDAALAGLVFDPQNKPLDGMANSDFVARYGADAQAKINGIAVSSASNTLTDNIPGVTIKLVAPTAVGSPLTMAISEDVTPAVKNVSDFVTAYNKLNQSLTDLTKYSAGTKTAGLFQGDASVVGLQNVLRSMLGSSSLGASSQYLSDVGLQRQLNGSLVIDTDKLSKAANNGTTLQQLFTNNNGDQMTNGFALKLKTLGQGVAASGGTVTAKVSALQKVLTSNTEAQAKVNERAELFETRLRKRYSALDAQMAQLNALNAYVTQQVTSWNKSTG